MTQPTNKEIIEALRGPIGAVGNAKRKELANRIESEGIAPPDGMVLVPSEPMSFSCQINGTTTQDWIPPCKAFCGRSACALESTAAPEPATDHFVDANKKVDTPDGWVLVPKEPTSEMVMAAWDTTERSFSFRDGYRAMLAAAPKQYVPSSRKLSDAPCNVCGYNGPGYYQPDTHPCAAPKGVSDEQ